MNEGMKKGVKQMNWVNEGNITDDHHRVATHTALQLFACSQELLKLPVDVM